MGSRGRNLRLLSGRGPPRARLRDVVHIAADLPQFIQRRELASYEQRLARTAYAYGVDLRRAQWLANSTVGDPLMRTVDRRWSGLVASLEKDSVRPLRKAPPTALLEELAGLIHLLRAPLPTVRLLRASAASGWPAVTPLGTTNGGIHWLVLDLDRVMAMPTEERTFALAAGLGHLQCDHGPIFAAHLMAQRGRGVRLVKGLMRPWAKVTVFSADRAGLLATCSLPAALQAVERQAAEHVAWMPRWPSLQLRRQALEDFDRSTIMARRRLLSDVEGRNGFTMAPAGREEELDSIARKLASALGGAIRMGGRLAMRIEGYERRPSDDDGTEAAPKAGDAAEADSKPDSKAARSPDDAAAADGEAPPPPEDPPLDPERASRLESALRDAWSLARCDQRLTRRLGLL